MKKSIILTTAAGVSLCLGIVAAQAGPGAHGQADTKAVPPTTPGFLGGGTNASTNTPGYQMQQQYTVPAARGPALGASSLTPGLNAPGRK
jgi:hypothetical protein